MRGDDGFLDFVLHELAPWAPVSVRRMFGAAGLFRGGVMFGFVSEDTLYLKVGATNRATFEAGGGEPFIYAGKGKPIEMSYWAAPPTALDDPEELRAVVAGAYRAALAARAGGPRPKRRTASSTSPHHHHARDKPRR